MIPATVPLDLMGTLVMKQVGKIKCRVISYAPCEISPLKYVVITECTQAQNLCENGGTCQFRMGSFFCECPPGFSGTLCERRLGKQI